MIPVRATTRTGYIVSCNLIGSNLVPRVFSLFKMAVAREKTLAHSRSRVSNEDGDVFKMAATAKRVRRTGYEMLRMAEKAEVQFKKK